MELAFDKAQHQTGLSHCWFAQQHQLELADLAVGCCAVGPRRSAPPCHSPVLKMWRKDPGVMGEYWFHFRLGCRAGWSSGSGVQVRCRQMTELVRTSPDGAAKPSIPLNVNWKWFAKGIHLRYQAQVSCGSHPAPCPPSAAGPPPQRITKSLSTCIWHQWRLCRHKLVKSSSKPHLCSETAPPEPEGANLGLAILHINTIRWFSSF